MDMNMCKSRTGLSLPVCWMFRFQNDSHIWLAEGEGALVQKQRSMLTPINVTLNFQRVVHLVAIVVEVVGDLSAKTF